LAPGDTNVGSRPNEKFDRECGGAKPAEEPQGVAVSGWKFGLWIIFLCCGLLLLSHALLGICSVIVGITLGREYYNNTYEPAVYAVWNAIPKPLHFIIIGMYLVALGGGFLMWGFPPFISPFIK
jgi:hypothetical protein